MTLAGKSALVTGSLAELRDLRRPAEITGLVESTRQAHGGVAILVNNAVVRLFSAVENFVPEQWDEALAVNLSAPFHAIRLALPGMKAAGWDQFRGRRGGFFGGAAAFREIRQG